MRGGLLTALAAAMRDKARDRARAEDAGQPPSRDGGEGGESFLAGGELPSKVLTKGRAKCRKGREGGGEVLWVDFSV